MNFVNKTINNRKLIFTISLIITLLSSSLLLTNQSTLTNDKSSRTELNIQFQSKYDPRKSNVYYEDTAGRSQDVYVSGDYAYVADREGGLAVIDISDPTNPGTPVYEGTSGTAYAVYVEGNYAYLADGTGLAVIDVSDPTNPGTPIYEATDGPSDVYVSGNYAYLADGSNGLAVIDISNPTNPGTPVYKDTAGFAYAIHVSGNYAYIADYLAGLAIIDISDPTNPGTPVYKDTVAAAQGVYVSGDYAYVGDGLSGLAVIDISDPTNPGTPIYENTAGTAMDIFVSGDYAYVADRTSGLAVIDISDPTNPGAPVYKDTTGHAESVFVSGNYAYVANGYSGLAVIKVSEEINPGAPVYEDTTGQANGIYVSGDYAYVGDWASGLAIIDISNPTNPGEPVYKITAGGGEGVYVDGNYVYLANSLQGLAVINVTDPTNPGTPVYEDTDDMVYSVYVSGNYAYLACGLSGLAVIDISDPTNPGTPVYEATIGGAYGIFVSGDYAYVAAYDSGLAIIDISDPTNPGTPVYKATTGQAEDVFVSGDYAYVANRLSGLAVIDISDPTNPGTPVYEDTTGEAYGIYVDGDCVYIADRESGLAIIDISDPTNPGTPIYENTAGNAMDVFVSGDYAYVADWGTGLAVIQVRQRTDLTTPIITDTPSDIIVETDYTSQSISWTATDLNPGNYTIELQGTGIIVSSTSWTSGVAITYDIPDGFSLGTYIYTVNFTDTYGNSILESVTFTVSDTNDPTITDIPSDITVVTNYTGESISWTATDLNPSNYTIELQGTGIVAGPTSWTSGVAITYDIPDSFSLGIYVYTVNFTDTSDNFIIESVTFTVSDTNDPAITVSPSNFTLESDYTSQSISWTATDLNPSNYTIELQGTGIVAGPTSWTSGVAITFNIPDGLDVGDYIYTVNFTDDGGNFVTESVTFTVSDTNDPILTDTPSDLTVEFHYYTGQSISWTATDLNPSTYTIELQGTGIVVGPTAWISGVVITYDIPDGLDVGDYVYTVNFTDDGGNFITESVTFTVGDTIDPTITISPSDLTVESDYSGQTISWTATDLNPSTYTIELQETGIVVTSTVWLSGVVITFNIPNGLAIGDHIYTVNFTDTSGNFITESVIFTVGDTIDPTVTISPSDLTVEFDYSGQTISWTATDLNPDTYTIELDGTEVVSSTPWTSGVAITFDIPDGLAVSNYTYIVTFTDTSGNSISDSVIFTVGDTIDPIITDAPSDLTVETDYTGQNISWTATDLNPDTYTIELDGTEVVSSTSWTSGVAITFDIPDGLAAGNYSYIVTFTDTSGNSISDSITFTVEETTGDGGGDSTNIIIGIVAVTAVVGVVTMVILRKRKQ